MVIDLPPGAYIGLVDDHHQRWVMDMGIPGPDQGRGGKHLVLGPDFDGDVPDGYYVGRSSSYKVLVALRALPVGGDQNKALDALRAVRIYPLPAAGADREPVEMVETTDRDIDSTCLRWEDNLQFWRVLHGILEAEPVVEEFRPMYGLLSSLGIGRGAPFEPDDRITAILERAAKEGRDQLLVSAFAGIRDDIRAWPDRRWEWVGLVPDNADFETSAGLDLEARDRWFAQAIVASPAMFRRSRAAARCTGSARVTTPAPTSMVDATTASRSRCPSPGSSSGRSRSTTPKPAHRSGPTRTWPRCAPCLSYATYPPRAPPSSASAPPPPPTTAAPGYRRSRVVDGLPTSAYTDPNSPRSTAPGSPAISRPPTNAHACSHEHRRTPASSESGRAHFSSNRAVRPVAGLARV